MREVHIAMCLIRQEDHYLLQHRLGDAMIGAAGLIGCFGGKIEDNETPEQAVCRELYEADESVQEGRYQKFKEHQEEYGVGDSGDPYAYLSKLGLRIVED